MLQSACLCCQGAVPILAAPSVDPLFGDLGCELPWALIFKQVKAGGSTN